MDSSIASRVIDLAIELQQIPAPTFHESERAVFLKQKFNELGLNDVSMDSVSNVFARLPGQSSDKSIVLTAHSDSVFPSDTDLKISRSAEKIFGAGIGDNATGLASLFGVLWQLKDQSIKLPGDLCLVANVGEEGLGNLIGMQKVVERFSNSPLAYIIVEGMSYGRIYNQGLAVQRYRITAKTKGGHSWVDHGSPSAIHHMAKMITQLTAIKLTKTPRTTFNVGKITGGVSVNSIASEAEIEIDIRTIKPKQMSELSRKVTKLVKRANKKGLNFEIEKIGERPYGVLSRDHPLVGAAQNILKDQGTAAEVIVGSTDANLPLSKGYPAICIGVTKGGGAHTLEEFIYPEFIERGISQIVKLISTAFELL